MPYYYITAKQTRTDTRAEERMAAEEAAEAAAMAAAEAARAAVRTSRRTSSAHQRVVKVREQVETVDEGTGVSRPESVEGDDAETCYNCGKHYFQVENE
eukprot:1819970-Pyramimonas_sp.AAC.1